MTDPQGIDPPAMRSELGKLQVCLLWVLVIAVGHVALGDVVPPSLGQTIDAPIAAARFWDRIPLAIREQPVNTLVIARDRTLWMGTANGLAAYVSEQVYCPSFGTPTDATALIGTTSWTLEDCSVLFGTINGTIWNASRRRISKLIDVQVQTSYSFARLPDERVAVAPGDFDDAQLSALRAVVSKAIAAPRGMGRVVAIGSSVYFVTPSGGVFK